MYSLPSMIRQDFGSMLFARQWRCKRFRRRNDRHIAGHKYRIGEKKVAVLGARKVPFGAEPVYGNVRITLHRLARLEIGDRVVAFEGDIAEIAGVDVACPQVLRGSGGAGEHDKARQRPGSAARLEESRVHDDVS